MHWDIMKALQANDVTSTANFPMLISYAASALIRTRCTIVVDEKLRSAERQDQPVQYGFMRAKIGRASPWPAVCPA